MRLEQYLAEHRRALDTTVSAAVEELMLDGDTDSDRRELVRSLYAALKLALSNMLAAQPGEGYFHGVSEGLAVTIYTPAPGRDLFGRFAINMGRLTVSGVVPCPNDWPMGRGSLPPLIENMIEVTRQPRGETRVITLDLEGKAELGKARAGQQYLVDEMPDGEMWLRPVETP